MSGILGLKHDHCNMWFYYFGVADVDEKSISVTAWWLQIFRFASHTEVSSTVHSIANIGSAPDPFVNRRTAREMHSLRITQKHPDDSIRIPLDCTSAEFVRERVYVRPRTRPWWWMSCSQWHAHAWNALQRRFRVCLFVCVCGAQADGRKTVLWQLTTAPGKQTADVRHVRVRLLALRTVCVSVCMCVFVVQ